MGSTTTPELVPLSAVFFGSSTTEGVGASDPALRWTAVVSREFGWTEVNRGLSGSTLTDRDGSSTSAEARWQAAVVEAQPDLVFVQYGANDIILGVPLGAPGEPRTFRNAAHVVLGGIQAALPAASIYVVEPQPMLSLSANRAAYDAALAEAAADFGLPLIRAGQAFPAGEYAADWIHLNDAGHAALAEYVAAVVGEIAPPSVSTGAELAAALTEAPPIRDGQAFPAGEYAPDWIHPNDAGHAALAEYVAAILGEIGRRASRPDTWPPRRDEPRIEAGGVQ